MSRATRSWRRVCSCRHRGVAFLALMLEGCATHVPQVLPPHIVPTTFTGQAGSEPVWPQSDWWRNFNSPELSDLIASAQADNHDLAAAAARVMEARARTTIQRSALFPQITGQAHAQRSAAAATQSTNSQPSSTSNSLGLTFGASYELDSWGLARDNLRAAREALKSARFAQQVVALTITANVANVYFSVLTLRERIAIANEDIAAINGILEIIKLNVGYCLL